MKINVFLTCAFAIFVTIGCQKSAVSPAAPSPDVSAHAVSNKCDKFIKTLPATYFHDWISVPEDPGNPSGNKIKVFYYGELIPGIIPVVFFNGGPEDDSHSSFQTLYSQQRIVDEYADVPFIFIDQRGTGCSDDYPAPKNAADFMRLTHYGSSGIVADAEAIRKKLIGALPWKIFGQSYGAYIVHRYVVLAPQSIVSASAHGNTLTSDSLLRLTIRIDSQHRVVQDYLQEFPDDEPLLRVISQQLTLSQCYVPKGAKNKICGKKLLTPIYSRMGFINSLPWLHTWLNVMASETALKPAGMQSYVDNVFPASTQTAPLDLGRAWAGTVLVRTENSMISITKPICTQVFASLVAKGEDPSSWYLDECQPLMDGSIVYGSGSVVDNLPTDTLDLADFAAALNANPQLKFYLYSGEKDPYVPKELFQEETKLLGLRIQYKNFSGTGHDGFESEPLVWQNLMAN